MRRNKCNFCSCIESEPVCNGVVRCVRCGFIYSVDVPLLNEIIGQNKDSIEKIYETIDCRVKLFKQVINLIKGKKGKLLDVGCKEGLFLDMAKKADYQTFGAEMNPKFCRHVKDRHNVFMGSFDELDMDNKYNVVTMIEMLEHTINPEKIIDKATEVLDKSGTIVVVVPNPRFHLLKGKIECLLGRQIIGISPKAHYNHFYPKVLVAILQSKGYATKLYIGATSSALNYGVMSNFLNNIAQKILKAIFLVTGFHLGSRLVIVGSKNVLSSNRGIK